MRLTTGPLRKDCLLWNGLIVITVPLLFGVAFSILLTFLLAESERKIQNELLLKDAMSTVARINGFALLARCCADAYFAFRDPYYKSSYVESFKTVKKEFAHVQKVLSQESGLQQNLQDMQQTIASVDRQCRGTLRLCRYLPGTRNLVVPEIKELIVKHGKDSSVSRLMVDHYGQQSGSLEQKLRHLAASRASAAVRSMLHIQLALVCSVAGSLLLTLLLALFFSRSVTRRLLIVVDNTVRLADGSPLNPPLGGSDEIAELDEFLYRSALEIRELERFKKELAGVVGHELKSPLSSVGTFLCSLSSGVLGDLSEKARIKAERAEKNVARLIELVKDLINLERLEAGKLEMSRERVAAAEIVARSVDSVKELSEKLGVRIERRNIEGTVWGDGSRLVQVFVNLLSNAMKFSPPGGTVSIETCNRDGWFEAKVSDQGRGISQSLQEKIFEPFQQVEAKDATEKKGTGLGLTICRNIVEQHNGRIGVDSVEGKGSTFWFKIPDQDMIDADAGCPASTAASVQRSKETQAESCCRPSSAPISRRRCGGLTILHKGLILISVPLGFELAFVILLTFLIAQNQEQFRLEERSKDVVVAGNQLLCEIAERENCAMLHSYTQDPELLKEWKLSSPGIESCYARLKQLTASDPEQKANIEMISGLLEEEDRLSTRLLNPAGLELDEFWSTPGLSEQAKAVLSRSQLVAENVVKVEKQNGERIFLQRAKAARFIEAALLVGSILNVLLSSALAVFLISSITNRLRHVMENMERLLRRQPLAAPSAGGDEIAYLDRVFYDAANHLTELEAFKQELISIVSHELRTPLMSIGASLNLLLSGALGELSEKARARMQIAEGETARLVLLITDLLDIEKMQAGKFIMVMSEQPVAELLEISLASVAEQAARKGIKIDLLADEGTICADRDRIVQVIVNLLSNAIKFSPEGERVDIAAASKGSRFELRVSDRGRGVPARMQERIFERFVQVEEKDAGDKGGSGLGLAISRSIVEQHGGRIGVESEAGSGSTFWFWLPVRDAQQAAMKKQHTPPDNMERQLLK
jgi:signal transduction histidine kinase